jgi:sortase A
VADLATGSGRLTFPIRRRFLPGLTTRLPSLPRNAGPRSNVVVVPVSAATRTFRWVTVAVGVLAFWVLLSTLVLGGFQLRSAQGRLYDDLRLHLADGTAPIGATDPGTPIALLAAPSLGISNLVVVEGTSSRQTQEGPGHRRDTPLPGQVGVSVLYGRGATYGAPFSSAPSLHPGDRITATTGQGIFTYVVDGVRRSGDPLPLPLAANRSRLTLVTTEGSGWRTGWAPSRTVFVDATLVGDAAVPDRPRPADVPAAEKLMSGDTGALVPVLLWAQLLLLVTCALSWGVVRWGRMQAWLVGAPLVVAALWGLMTSATQLLPNLL